MVLTTSNAFMVPSAANRSPSWLTVLSTRWSKTYRQRRLVYFPYIMTLFMFIRLRQLPWSDPGVLHATSHFAVTVVLAMASSSTSQSWALSRTVRGFLGLFWVALPPGLASGSRDHRSHLLLRAPCQPLHSFGWQRHGGPRGIKVFAGFARYSSCQPSSILGDHSDVRPRSLVSAIQAYVFTILTCVYLKDALHPSH